MAASYPSATKSFTTKSDGPTSTIFAAHINDLQDEVVAIEADLRSGQIGGTGVPTNGSVFKAGDGSVSAPGISFNSDTNTGVYRSGADALDFATGGTKALGIDSTQFVDFITQPRCVAYMNTTQSLSDSTETAVTFNTEDVDVGAMHDTSSNTSRFTVPTGGDGFYEFIAHVSFAANATGNRYTRFRKNGTTSVGTRVALPPNGSNFGSADQPVVLNIWSGTLAAADYIEVLAYQSSTGAMNIGHAATRDLQCQMIARKVF
jgi:hypothetical protein